MSDHRNNNRRGGGFFGFIIDLCETFGEVGSWVVSGLTDGIVGDLIVALVEGIVSLLWRAGAFVFQLLAELILGIFS